MANTVDRLIDRLEEIASLMSRGQLTQPRKVGVEIQKIVIALRVLKEDK